MGQCGLEPRLGEGLRQAMGSIAPTPSMTIAQRFNWEIYGRQASRLSVQCQARRLTSETKTWPRRLCCQSRSPVRDERNIRPVENIRVHSGNPMLEPILPSLTGLRNLAHIYPVLWDVGAPKIAREGRPPCRPKY
jgi:hypothetical protein